VAQRLSLRRPTRVSANAPIMSYGFDYMDLTGKRLLVLGGTYASLDVVKTAQSMGVYVIVTDDQDTSKRVAKQIADETAMISTADIDSLVDFVKSKRIDGAFCGPSESNIRNLISLCERAGLPCYATSELWDRCSNKESFKAYCRRNNVPTAPEYEIDLFRSEGRDGEVEYPVIVKPVDGCSSKGISICNCREDVLLACDFALQNSSRKRAVIERYIDNGGRVFSVRYLMRDGEYRPYLTLDTYVVDPIHRRYLISGFSYAPSSLTDRYLSSLDERVQNMFHDMGLMNGTAFIQAIPHRGTIYCHEMGYRLSGGMIYKITEPLMGIHDMKMMIRVALGGRMYEDEEVAGIDLQRQDLVMGQLMMPLRAGTIGRVIGLDDVLSMEAVTDFLQYYYEGDTVLPAVLGTLGQHFGRLTLKSTNPVELIAVINQIQDKIRILDEDGHEMWTMRFDTSRIAID